MSERKIDPRVFLEDRERLLPVIPAIPKIEIPDSVKNQAKWAYEQIVKAIIRFERKLDQDHEIGARLVNFGGHETFHIENVGCCPPHFIRFIGRTVEGQPVELIQHVSQTSVLLVAMKKQREEPNRIGFALGEQLQAS
jgi:hypothetical protein